ncbi:MAG: energy-coupling factor transporter transmembrane protein EcfT [Clostridia bacterium]|nr:energy-coupling factor transporter transmembrane protein EcfT [Clostridia bacterium]
MNEFKTYHPIVNFVYFAFVIGFSCVFMHPVSLGISLSSGFIYFIMLKGKKAAKINLIYMFPMMILMTLINPLFNHEGVTIIGYLPSGNPLTLESALYGFAATAMIFSVICHFSCYNEVMTSDKFLYLFGKVIPSLSLVISLTLGFVPKFTAQLKTVADAQKCMGRDVSNGNIIKRAKYGLNILSIMTTWALENAIETADSMKSRGYGLSGRTSFSVFTFDKRDKKALVCILILGIYTLAGNLLGGMEFEYFPRIKGTEASLFNVSIFASYLLLCIYPVIIEIWEVRRWKAIESKI